MIFMTERDREREREKVALACAPARLSLQAVRLSCFKNCILSLSTFLLKTLQIFYKKLCQVLYTNANTKGRSASKKRPTTTIQFRQHSKNRKRVFCTGSVYSSMTVHQ